MDGPQSSSSQSQSSCAEDLAADLELVSCGDVAALCRLYRATKSRMSGVCKRVTGDAVLAEDVLQEVYLKVWLRASSFDSHKAHPLAWLTGIARNSSIDAMRADRRRKNRDRIEVVEPFELALGIEDELIARESEIRALVILGDLGRPYQDHVREVYLKGHTYAEAAMRSGVPEGTIKSRVSRALKVLNGQWRSSEAQEPHHAAANPNLREQLTTQES